MMTTISMSLTYKRVQSKRSMTGPLAQDRAASSEAEPGQQAGKTPKSNRVQRVKKSRWKETYRLREAQAIAASMPGFVVYAKEKLYNPFNKSCRAYVVTTEEQFLQRYWREEPKNWYEVIQCGTACKIYMDLDLERANYANLDFDQLLVDIRQSMITFIDETYTVKSSSENVTILEASSGEKFSAHLIFQDFVCENNQCCKEVVKQFINSHPEVAHIKGDDNSFRTVIDRSAYTNNQNLRLLGSNKFRQDRPLRASSVDLSHLAFGSDRAECSTQQFLKYTMVSERERTTNIHLKRKEEFPQSVATHWKTSDSRKKTLSRCPNYDNFVRQLVLPGSIDYIVEESGNTLTYHLKGQVYCRISKRNHRHAKSFVKLWITNHTIRIYQKCFHHDCTTKDILLWQEEKVFDDDSFEEWVCKNTDEEDDEARRQAMDRMGDQGNPEFRQSLSTWTPMRRQTTRTLGHIGGAEQNNNMDNQDAGEEPHRFRYSFLQ